MFVHFPLSLTLFDDIGGEITCVCVLAGCGSGVGPRNQWSRERANTATPGGGSGSLLPSEFSVCNFSPTGREAKTWPCVELVLEDAFSQTSHVDSLLDTHFHSK